MDHIRSHATRIAALVLLAVAVFDHGPSELLRDVQLDVLVTVAAALAIGPRRRE